MLATAAELRDEAEVLEQAVEEALRRTGAGGVPPAVDAGRLAAEPAPRPAAGPAPARGGCGRRHCRRSARRSARDRAPRRARAAAARWTSAAGCGRPSSTASSASARHRTRSQPPAPVRPGGPGQVPVRRLGAWSRERGPAAPRRRPRIGRRAAARRGPARGHAHRAGMARRRPHAAARPRRDQVAPGPVQRPQGAALAAALPAGGGVRTARSPGWRASRSRSASGSTPVTHRATVRLSAVRRRGDLYVYDCGHVPRATLSRCSTRRRDDRRGGGAPAPRGGARSADHAATTRVATSS